MHKLAYVLPLVMAVACGDSNGDDGVDPPGDGGGDVLPPLTERVSTLAGSSEAGLVDGPRGVARFNNPVNVAYGPDGKVYVADFDNSRIRVVDPADGATSTLFERQGFRRPFGLAFVGNTLYVTTDSDPNGGHSAMSGTIWRVDVAARSATPVVTSMGRPRGIAALSDGRLVVSDYQHQVVEIVNPTSGSVTILAGVWDDRGMVDAPGDDARFSTPYGVVVVNDQIYVADFDNNRIRRVDLDGSVQTVAGGAAGYVDGPVASARFDGPQGLAVTTSGDIYVTDANNYRIRRISGGAVSTIAGSGIAGYSDGNDLLRAQFFGLEGLAVTPDGTRLFVADGNRGEPQPFNRVRSVRL